MAFLGLGGLSRRTVAGLVAAGLLLVLVVAGALLPVPYVALSPGLTVDVLATYDDKPIVQVDGARSYPTEGELRLTTVSVTRPDADVTLVEALGAWMRRDVDLLPYEVYYSEDDTAEEERTVSAAQMVNSQDTAVAAALRALGYEFTSGPEVLAVYPGQPADGELRSRDRLLAVGERPTRDVRDVTAALRRLQPGDPVAVRVDRDGEERTVRLTTVAADEDPDRAVIGIQLGTGYEFPVDVRVRLDERIGGPSAGLVFALSVYDVLTPGPLTGGAVVAGTGTIAPDGSVGPIGGVRQKIAGATDAGAELFLVPPDNCAAALQAPAADELRLVRADTFDSALQALETYADDPEAALPECAA